MSRRGFYAEVATVAGACLVVLCLFSSPRCADPGTEEPSIRENLLPALKGDAQAQLFVGYLYETGQGVEPDYSRAAQWYRKAAEQGNATAQLQLGNMYRLGKGVAQSCVMAYLWYDLAARGGVVSARDLRRAVARGMSPAEIAEAKRMSGEWKPGRR